jgi:two-component system OmpR family sensor kinase
MNTRSIRFRLGAWYTGLLAILLLAFGAFVYLTLERFLAQNLQDTLSKEAQTIGNALLSKVAQAGDDFVIEEIEEHFAPRTTSHFLRITRANGSILYQSGRPHDGTFEPEVVSPALLGDAPSWHEQKMPNGRKLVVYSMTYSDSLGTRYTIQAGASDIAIQQVLRGLLISLSIVLPLVLVAAVGGGLLFVRNALTPLEQIATTAEKITSRNLNERLHRVVTGDEIEKLSASLNRMMDRLEESFHHVHRFSADVSHEIRTPLSILRAELEDLLKTQELTPRLRESIGSALEEVERLSRIAEQLLEMTRLEAGEMLSDLTVLDLGDLARTTVEQLRLLADEKKLAMNFHDGPSLPVLGDSLRLRQVVVNLVDNAIKYTPQGGTISISSGQADGRAILEVSDTGIGIPQEALPHIFERFYRVDGARSRHLGGTGLGLAIVRSICTAFGGAISVQSVSGSGTTFRVELPLESSDSRHRILNGF